jgi:hypothetical protein
VAERRAVVCAQRKLKADDPSHAGTAGVEQSTAAVSCTLPNLPTALTLGQISPITRFFNRLPFPSPRPMANPREQTIPEGAAADATAQESGGRRSPRPAWFPRSPTSPRARSTPRSPRPPRSPRASQPAEPPGSPGSARSQRRRVGGHSDFRGSARRSLSSLTLTLTLTLTLSWLGEAGRRGRALF